MESKETITVHKPVITIWESNYKALLKFRTFVKTYYPNYHICNKCGELMPENGICFHCYPNIDLELPDKIGLVVNDPNSIENKIKQLNDLNEWSGQK